MTDEAFKREVSDALKCAAIGKAPPTPSSAANTRRRAVSDLVEQLRRAFDADSVAEKNLAIRAAYDLIAAMQADAAPVAMVRVTNGGYAMSLAQYVAYSLPEGDHWLYAHPPVDARVSTSNPVVDHETGNTSDKLRDAVDVYLAAGAAYWGTDTSETDAIGLKLAAAVIEADRQANRAALVAEIVEWLRDGAGIGASLAHPSVLQAIEAKWSKL